MLSNIAKSHCGKFLYGRFLHNGMGRNDYYVFLFTCFYFIKPFYNKKIQYNGDGSLFHTVFIFMPPDLFQFYEQDGYNSVAICLSGCFSLFNTATKDHSSAIKVAIIIPRIDFLGPIKVMQELVNSLSTWNELKISVYYIDQNVDSRLEWNVKVARLDRKEFPFGDFDIIHTNGIRPDLFAFIHRKKIKYHISTIHNFVFEDLYFTYNRLVSSIFGIIWIILWNRADILVCVSTALKSYYSRWFNNEKLVVIHNGIGEYNKSLLAEQRFIDKIDNFHSSGFTIIGFSGILTRRKGVDQVLRLLSLKADFAFVIIGDGSELHALTQQAKCLNVSDRCLFCGLQENAVRYFRYFDLFIMPSRSEGFGLALIEAVQQRIPVVCSDLKVFKEILSDSEAYFFKTDDMDSLIVAVNNAVNDKSGRKSEKAYSRYINNYTAGLMAKKYYDLYKSVQT
jgi:glycosyltransferase involved in cell wall biosynthesis